MHQVLYLYPNDSQPHERLAHATARLIWRTYDGLTGYRHDRPQSEAQWLQRLIVMEAMAGCVPPGGCMYVVRSHVGASRGSTLDAPSRQR